MYKLVFVGFTHTVPGKNEWNAVENYCQMTYGDDYSIDVALTGFCKLVSEFGNRVVMRVEKVK